MPNVLNPAVIEEDRNIARCALDAARAEANIGKDNAACKRAALANGGGTCEEAAAAAAIAERDGESAWNAVNEVAMRWRTISSQTANYKSKETLDRLVRRALTVRTLLEEERK